MSLFKKFFEKKKLDSKFKKAGQGHSLTEPTPSKVDSSKVSQTTEPAKQRISSGSARMAGVAALQRIENSSAPNMINRSQQVIRAKAQKKLEAESQHEDSQKMLTTKQPDECLINAFFKCPLIGNDVLPKEEIDIKIKEFLYEQLEEDPGVVSCLIIQTCNKDKEKIQMCVETIAKCINNILEHPTDDKFRKIRVNSKAFQDKFVHVEGALEFLSAAGFNSEKRLHTSGEEEMFYVLSSDPINHEYLELLRDALLTAEPIHAELDRSVKVLVPAMQSKAEQLPDYFYNVTVEDVKQEQHYLTDAVEKSLVLQTKECRMLELSRVCKRYRFCYIRIRFPDGVMLQGTFKSWEKLSDLNNFIKEHLVNEDIDFKLSFVNGQHLEGDDCTLADLCLVPAAIVNFVSDACSNNTYLKMETLSLCSEL